MSSGASKDYKFGTKNNWRRTIWNDIARRVGDRKNAVVLYLAGEHDYDRPVAMDKGFDGRNLIAVERDGVVAASLRRKGVLVIESDFIDLLEAWPANKKVDVLFGDFCGGLHDRLSANLDLTLMREGFQRTVFSFNFQRGRDPFGSESVRYGRMLEGNEEKHRGRLLAARSALLLGGLVGFPADGNTQADLDEHNAFMADCRLHLRSKFFGYKSGKLNFDSVVFEGFRGDGLPGRVIRSSRAISVSRRIASVLAHRTMRLNKVGPYAERRAA